MRKTAQSVLLVFLTLVGVVALAVSATITSAGFSLAATTTALIMGGTGRPDPQDFPGYMENFESYYIIPNTTCGTADVCDTVSVFTPETAWPLYGGPDALTLRDSILQGVKDLDRVVQRLLPGLTVDNRLVIAGYSQSGAIVALEKAALAAQLTPLQQELIEFVIIGNLSRANGGLNGRANGFSIPIVNFPFGPTVPTNTEMLTTDIAMKWEMIADAPLVITNPIAMLNALLGFEDVHGTYPDPTQASPDSTPGGYTQAQWQAIMNNPEGYAALNPGLVNVQTFGDTKFITVTPTVLPLVAPLHQIGLKPLADLVEPALRAFIEHTGYDRSIPYGQPTPFRLIPIFNPIALAVDLLLAIPQGITNMINGLQGEPTYPLIDPPSETLDVLSVPTQSDPPVDEATSRAARGAESLSISTNSSSGPGLNSVQDPGATVKKLATEGTEGTDGDGLEDANVTEGSVAAAEEPTATKPEDGDVKVDDEEVDNKKADDAKDAADDAKDADKQADDAKDAADDAKDADKQADAKKADAKKADANKADANKADANKADDGEKAAA